MIALADGAVDERRIHTHGVAGRADGDVATQEMPEQSPNKALHPTPARAIMGRRAAQRGRWPGN